MAFTFQRQSKFALLAIENVFTELPTAEVQLSDGTWVLSAVPLADLGGWTEWVGSIGVRRLGAANLVLLREELADDPSIVDAVHERMDDALTRLFYLLQLSGVAEYEGAELLHGSSIDYQLQIRQIGDLHKLFPSKGYTRTPITLGRLNDAIQLCDGLKEMELGSAARFLRGMNALTDGLMRNDGQDRLHQFVRSLEALIVPDVGQTRKQFIHRCQTFAAAGTLAVQVLGDAFDMRSDTEHLHDWERGLQAYVPAERDDVGWQRTRQMQRLATFAYSRILENEKLRSFFRNEAAQQEFWKGLDDSGRKANWGNGFNLSLEPIVHRYDQWSRAVLTV